METANIIMAVCLIVLMGVAVWLIIRYMRKSTEVKIKEQALDVKEKELRKKESHLNTFAANVRRESDKLDAAMAKMTHVGYTVTINDPDGTAPSQPDKAVLKSLKSGLGYKTVPVAQKYIKCKRVDGRTKYSLDIYVAPFDAGKDE